MVIFAILLNQAEKVLESSFNQKGLEKEIEMKKLIIAVMAVVVIFSATSAMAAQVRLAGYYDTREQENITLTVSQQLKNGFAVWGFVDLWTNRANSATKTDDQADFTSFYGESNLNYGLNQNWRLMLELNDGSAVSAVLRPGILYVTQVPTGRIGFKLLPYRLDLVDQEPAPDSSGQLGLNWRFDWLGNKVFFEGFADLNWFWENQKDFYPLVTEPQLGFNLSQNTAFLVEYRYSNLNALTKEADQGWGIGLEYRF
jgi:hypothetical protein